MPTAFDLWISVKEAAALLSTSRQSVRRLCTDSDPITLRPYLVCCRPTPGLILVSRTSVENHMARTGDIDFWETRKEASKKRAKPRAPFK